ncbi:MAG: energy transducer TonB [Methylovulum sp.]|nr:energy transducer TonB [Methylovulum sp.]
MNSPLLNFQQLEADIISPRKSNTAKVFPFKPAGHGEALPAASPLATASDVTLGHFQAGTGQSDKKWFDYLIIGVLSVVIHGLVADYFQQARTAIEEMVEPAKVQPKVQINLLRPQPPKPKPVIQPPPPPPPKAVPLKQPPKQRKPKPVVKRVEPPPVQQSVPVIESKAPVMQAPPVAQPAPPPPVVEKVTEPQAGANYLHNPSPEYPEAAMDRGLEGKVLMKVHVQPSGKPDTVTVTKSSGHTILDDAAVRTVKQWSFVPAMRGKTPIAGWVTVPIAFNLQN